MSSFESFRNGILFSDRSFLEKLRNFRFDEEDIDYLESLHIFYPAFLDYLKDFRFKGNIYAVPEGTVVFPGEPLLRFHGTTTEAMLLETGLSMIMNHESLIATKARRVRTVAPKDALMEFGLRRAQGHSAGLWGARAAMIGGFNGTSNVEAGKRFGIPVLGTMAHSWVMYHDDEYTAFKQFAELYPDNSVLLVDTYDVFKSGIPNAIRVAREVLIPRGKRLKGIRLDSGDLAYLSKAARRMLDEAGLTDCKIVASNSLDEFTIRSILEQGGCIDAFGVGERLITARSDPVFGAVYKLVAVNKGKACYPKIKVSETFEKITNPGKKQVWRVYDGQGHAVSDLITMAEETPDFSGEYPYVNPQRPWRTFVYSGCTARRMHELVMEDGRRVKPSPSLEDIRAYVKRQLETEIWPEEQRFENPHRHYLDMSPAYYRMKMELLSKAQNGTL